MLYNGLSKYSLIDSAVNVFPTPGGPCNKKMQPPPFPSIKSLIVSPCFSTRA